MSKNPPEITKKTDWVTLAMSWLRKLLPWLALAMFAVAIGFIHHLLRGHSYHELKAQIYSIPISRRLMALGLTAASYFVLSFYDELGFIYLGQKLSFPKTAFTSITAFAFTNTIGLANIAGSSIRLRIYASFGIDPKDILKLIAFVSASFWVGFFCLAGVTLTIYPLQLPERFGISQEWVRAVGILLLLVAAAYLAFCGLRRKPLRVRGVDIPLPSFRLSVLQALVAAGDWMIVSGVLYVLLPTSIGIGYAHFLSIFITAQVVALMAHVPGGVGILEAMVISLIADERDTPAVLAALLAFRMIYYLLPLVVSAGGLIAYEIYQQRHRVRKLSFDWTPHMLPQVTAVTSFLAGLVVLASSATPADSERMTLLASWMPLAVIEACHFLSSVVAASLLFTARGLLFRGRQAWRVSFTLLLVGAVLSLGQGLSWEEAILLAVFAGFLFAARTQFHRRTPLFTRDFSAPWVVAIAMVIIGCSWLGIFAHRHLLEYKDELWWTFRVHSDAPRFLRAALGALLTGALFAVVSLLRPLPRSTAAIMTDEDRALVARVGASHSLPASENPDSVSVLISRQHDAILRYRVMQKVWVAIGGPIGEADSFEDLIYDFKQLAEESKAQAVFYDLESETLPLYVDLGMVFVELAREKHFLAYPAHMPLAPLLAELKRTFATA